MPAAGAILTGRSDLCGALQPAASLTVPSAWLRRSQRPGSRSRLGMITGVSTRVSKVQNLLDYLLAARTPAFLAGSTQMAVNAAIAMGVLAIGVLAQLGSANPFALLAGNSSTAVLLRLNRAVLGWTDPGRRPEVDWSLCLF